MRTFALNLTEQPRQSLVHEARSKWPCEVSHSPISLSIRSHRHQRIASDPLTQPWPARPTHPPGGSCPLTAHACTRSRLKTEVHLGYLVLSFLFRAKSEITPRDTWGKRQAGAMGQFRRAGWVWAASCERAHFGCGPMRSCTGPRPPRFGAAEVHEVRWCGRLPMAAW